MSQPRNGNSVLDSIHPNVPNMMNTLIINGARAVKIGSFMRANIDKDCRNG